VSLTEEQQRKAWARKALRRLYVRLALASDWRREELLRGFREHPPDPEQFEEWIAEQLDSIGPDIAAREELTAALKTLAGEAAIPEGAEFDKIAAEVAP
jgi:hypothetical protein